MLLKGSHTQIPRLLSGTSSGDLLHPQSLLSSKSPSLLSGQSNLLQPSNLGSAVSVVAPTQSSTNYVLFFTISNWISVSEFFQLSIPSAQHNMGTNVVLQIFEFISGSYELVTVNNTIVDNSGNVLLISSEAFNGKFVIS